MRSPTANRKRQDYKERDDFEYIMDVAIEPNMEVSLDEKDKLTYYDVGVSDKCVDERIDENAHGSRYFRAG